MDNLQTYLCSEFIYTVPNLFTTLLFLAVKEKEKKIKKHNILYNLEMNIQIFPSHIPFLFSSQYSEATKNSSYKAQLVTLLQNHRVMASARDTEGAQQ